MASFFHEIWSLLFFGESNPWWQLLTFQWIDFFGRPWNPSFWTQMGVGGGWLLFWVYLVKNVIMVSYYVSRAVFFALWSIWLIPMVLVMVLVGFSFRIIGIIPVIGRPFSAIGKWLVPAAGRLINANVKEGGDLKEELTTTDDLPMHPAAMYHYFGKSSGSSKKG